jgi:hypothetical protein
MLSGKIAVGQDYHHNIFSMRLSFADTINKRTKVEFHLQKRTQSTAYHHGNPFKSNQINSFWFFLHFNVGKASQISLSPFAYYENFSLNVKPNDEDLPPVKEYRVTARYTNEQRWRVVDFINRFTVEYRLRDLRREGIYKSNFRMRYMAKLEKAVYQIMSAKRRVAFELSDEVFIQFGNAVRNYHSVFDQNRLYFGFNYEVFRNCKTSLGYSYGFQERASGNEFDKINMLWTGVTFENLFTQFKHRRNQ